MKSRCSWSATDPLYKKYHDREWGVPLHDDRKLFEFLILEGAQAGLSWLTILRNDKITERPLIILIRTRLPDMTPAKSVYFFQMRESFATSLRSMQQFKMPFYFWLSKENSAALTITSGGLSEGKQKKTSGRPWRRYPPKHRSRRPCAQTLKNAGLNLSAPLFAMRSCRRPA